MQPVLNVRDVPGLEAAIEQRGVDAAELMRRAGTVVAQQAMREVDQGAVGTVSDDRDAEGDAEARTGLGSDPEGVHDDFTDTASLGGNPASG